MSDSLTVVYRKTSGAWVEVDPSTLDPTAKYVRA